MRGRCSASTGPNEGSESLCLHNPANGRDLTPPHHVAPAREAKTAVVVGAGPAGLEAARVLAKRGQQVTVVEAASQPGRQVAIAAVAPRRDDPLQPKALPATDFPTAALCVFCAIVAGGQPSDALIQRNWCVTAGSACRTRPSSLTGRSQLPRGQLFVPVSASEHR